MKTFYLHRQICTYRDLQGISLTHKHTYVIETMCHKGHLSIQTVGAEVASAVLL